jgi:hypothetical protein
MLRAIVCLLAGLSLVVIGNHAVAQSDVTSDPIFQTGVPNPTQDKPQSKLWFAWGRYWAWLPVPGGSTVLERTPSGWREVGHLRSHLADLPGQADVWADESSVRAVLVGNDRLTVVGLKFDAAQNTYQPGAVRYEFPLAPLAKDGDRLETATIARDSRGRWWVACDRDQQITAFWTTDAEGLQWSSGFTLGANTHRDDISTLVVLPDRVGVVWSDQVADAVYFREHLDGQPPADWGQPITVQQGGKTADDHLSAVVAEDGTLFVATKNSVDQVGAPQLVLRIRRPDGSWENHPYAVLQDKLGPSRPIALLAGQTQQLYLLHTMYDSRDPQGRRDYIAAIRPPRSPLELTGPEVRILTAAKPVNNVTGTKRPFAATRPWIVLASDSDGGIYEAVLPDSHEK